MRLYNMLGYKLFKEKEDGSLHVVRIVHIRKPFKITSSTKDPDEMTIFDYDTNERRKVRVSDFKDYSPLKPDGILTLSIAGVRDSKGKICRDVIVTATKFLNIEFKVNVMPYAVCRQNISDIFYNMFINDENDQLVGLAVNQDTCPANFDFGIMFACDNIEKNDFINFYRTDTLEDVLALVNTKKYDETLDSLFKRHCEVIKNPIIYNTHKEHGGWCKNLRTLLDNNNFQADINQMLGIADVEFNISDYTVDNYINGKNDSSAAIITQANDELRYWLSLTYKVNIKEANILEFDHDINLGDFNNANYLLIRDNTKTLYLIVYLVEGEFFEADLKAKAEELDFSTKFRIKFYDKYNISNNK